MNLREHIITLAGKEWDKRTYQEYLDGWASLNEELERRQQAIAFGDADREYLNEVFGLLESITTL